MNSRAIPCRLCETGFIRESRIPDEADAADVPALSRTVRSYRFGAKIVSGASLRFH